MRRRISLLFIICALMMILSACSSDEEPEVTTTDETQQVVSDSSSDSEANSSVSETDSEKSQSDITQAQDKTDINNESSSTEPVTASDDTISEQEDSATTTEQKKDSSSRITQIWNNGFLIWLPEFEGGDFVSSEAADTFDYITIGNIKDKSIVEDYIKKIREAGFNISEDLSERNNQLNYSSFNMDDWNATIKYDETSGEVIIGCGFIDEEEDADKDVWKDTLLVYLPEPDFGTISMNYSESEEGQFDYVVMEDVTIEDMRDYASKLEDAGYIYDVDTGEDADMLWYIAYNEDSMICELEYAEGICSLGSGFREE